MRPVIPPARYIHPVIFITAFFLCAAASVSRASDAIASAWSTGHPGGSHGERRECLRAAMEECSKWRQLRVSAWYNDLWDVCLLPGTDLMWAVGESIVCRSCDGGCYWDVSQPALASDSLPGATVTFYCVHFHDSLIGWAAGRTRIVASTPVILECQEKIGGVCVVHPDVVYAVGKAQVLKLDITSPGGIPDIPVAARSIVLHRNYPNPFNPVTTIRFDLPHPAHVRLCVYTVKGEFVTTLVDRRMPGGRSEIVWTARDSRERAISSGIYFYCLVSGDFVQTKKMVLLRQYVSLLSKQGCWKTRLLS
jgi:hypothetical protein